MLFELNRVTKRYGNVVALRDLSVSIPTGAIGLLGPNGAGKTTMIRTLLGLIRIDEGEGSVLGLDIRRRRLQVRQQTGFVPEDECLFPGVAGVDFVAYAGELAGMRRREALQRAHQVLDYVRLGDARYRQADSYSTGMKQRLKLASAIVHDPRLLILDEPTNGMDPEGRTEILKLARDLASAKGMSLLFSSHLLPDVEAVCEHVMVMGSGRLLLQGKIHELKKAEGDVVELRVRDRQEQMASELRAAGCSVEPHKDLLRVGLSNGYTLQTIWRLAAEKGHQVRHLKPLRSTLEEVFLQALAEAS